MLKINLENMEIEQNIIYDNKERKPYQRPEILHVFYEKKENAYPCVIIKYENLNQFSVVEMDKGKLVKRLIPMLNGERYIKIKKVNKMVSTKGELKFIFFGESNPQ